MYKDRRNGGKARYLQCLGSGTTRFRIRQGRKAQITQTLRHVNKKVKMWKATEVRAVMVLLCFVYLRFNYLYSEV